MKKHYSVLAISTLIFSLISLSANAALVSRLNGQAVYDTDLDITWLADAGLAATNNFGVSGITATGPYASGTMNWATAQNWIGAMNTANYLGYSDWRLPATLQPDPTCGFQSGDDSFGWNCTGSELGHLFYNELGGAAGSTIEATHNANFGLFQNIQSYYYWSGTIYAQDPSYSWYFSFYDGGQGPVDNDYTIAWAVRTGDVATVPLPAAFWFFGSGLIGLFGFMRRGRAQNNN